MFSVQLVSTPSAEAILFVVVKPSEALRLFAILEPYPKSVLQPTANRSVIHVNSQLTAALKENGHIIISFSTVFWLNNNHMASSSSSLNFLAPMDVKLNGSNYKEWFTIVHIILIGLELLGQVDGTSS